MRFILILATIQGQTRKIVQHVDQRLTGRGHEAVVIEADGQTTIDPDAADAVILAGPLYSGRYPSALVDAARNCAAAWGARPALFLSVSLTAAGDDPSEHAELDRLARGFLTDTGWQGARVAQVAGAMRCSDDSFFEYWALRWLSRHWDRKITSPEEIELTDWQSLDALIEGFMAGLAPRR